MQSYLSSPCKKVRGVGVGCSDRKRSVNYITGIKKNHYTNHEPSRNLKASPSPCQHKSRKPHYKDYVPRSNRLDVNEYSVCCGVGNLAVRNTNSNNTIPNVFRPSCSIHVNAKKTVVTRRSARDSIEPISREQSIEFYNSNRSQEHEANDNKDHVFAVKRWTPNLNNSLKLNPTDTVLSPSRCSNRTGSRSASLLSPVSSNSSVTIVRSNTTTAVTPSVKTEIDVILRKKPFSNENLKSLKHKQCQTESKIPWCSVGKSCIEYKSEVSSGVEGSSELTINTMETRRKSLKKVVYSSDEESQANVPLLYACRKVVQTQAIDTVKPSPLDEEVSGFDERIMVAVGTNEPSSRDSGLSEQMSRIIKTPPPTPPKKGCSKLDLNDWKATCIDSYDNMLSKISLNTCQEYNLNLACRTFLKAKSLGLRLNVAKTPTVSLLRTVCQEVIAPNSPATEAYINSCFHMSQEGGGTCEDGRSYSETLLSDTIMCSDMTSLPESSSLSTFSYRTDDTLEISSIPDAYHV